MLAILTATHRYTPPAPALRRLARRRGASAFMRRRVRDFSAARPPASRPARSGVVPSRRGRLRVPRQAEYPFADDVELDVGRAAPDGERPGQQHLAGPVRAVGLPGGTDGRARAAAERAVS